MRAPLILAVTALCAASPAHPGAWPREPGAAFVSLRTDADITGPDRATSASLYGEYGLTSRTTLVGQLSNDDNPWTASRAGIAVNYALTSPDATQRFAVSFGVSAPPDMMGAYYDTRLETGLHWGTGFASRYGAGWATATVRILQPVTEGDLITDVFGLVGVRPREGWMTMIGAGRYEDDLGVTWKVSPSLGYQVHPKAWIVPGVTREIGGAGITTVNLGLWLNF